MGLTIQQALQNNNHNLLSLLCKCGAQIDLTEDTTLLEAEIIANSYKYDKETVESLLHYTSSEQNTEVLERFSSQKSLKGEDFEIMSLLRKKIDPCSQSQLGSKSQEAQATPLIDQQNSEESDDEFYDAEEDIAKGDGEDKLEGNTRQPTVEESSNDQSGGQKSSGPESAGSQRKEKNALSSTKESDTINNLRDELKETKNQLTVEQLC